MLRNLKLFFQIALAIFVPFILLEQIQLTFFPEILQTEVLIIGPLLGVLAALVVGDRYISRHRKESNVV
ncbi:MAG: hypothetical protein AAGN35_28010 [Bacteroidota bacterium]